MTSMSMDPARRRSSSPVARIIVVLVVVWLIIGLIAAVQRHYFSSGNANCAKFSTTAVTIIAGPLNYLGANPKVKCPKPSK